jgi:hypothetical protein
MRAGGAIQTLEGRTIVQCHTRHQRAKVVGCRHRVPSSAVIAQSGAAIVAWSAPLGHGVQR